MFICVTQLTVSIQKREAQDDPFPWLLINKNSFEWRYVIYSFNFVIDIVLLLLILGVVVVDAVVIVVSSTLNLENRKRF